MVLHKQHQLQLNRLRMAGVGLRAILLLGFMLTSWMVIFADCGPAHRGEADPSEREVAAIRHDLGTARYEASLAGLHMLQKKYPQDRGLRFAEAGILLTRDLGTRGQGSPSEQFQRLSSQLCTEFAGTPEAKALEGLVERLKTHGGFRGTYDDHSAFVRWSQSVRCGILARPNEPNKFYWSITPPPIAVESKAP